MNKENMKIETIRTVRDRYGLSNAQVAAVLGEPEKRIAEWVTRKCEARGKTVRRKRGRASRMERAALLLADKLAALDETVPHWRVDLDQIQIQRQRARERMEGNHGDPDDKRK